MSTPLNPASYLLQTLNSLWENLPNILLGGLLFTLCCAPAFLLALFGWVGAALITIPLLVAPAWSALMRLQASMLAGKATNVMEMVRAFPRFWRQSFRLGVIGVVPIYLIIRQLPTMAQPDVAWFMWVAFFVTLLATAFVCALYLYAFPLTVLYDAPLGVVLPNSAILASRHAGNTVGLLSMGVLFALATGYLSLALLFIVPALYAYFIVNHCRLVVGEEQR